MKVLGASESALLCQKIRGNFFDTVVIPTPAPTTHVRANNSVLVVANLSADLRTVITPNHTTTNARAFRVITKTGIL